MTDTGFGRFIDDATIQYERIFPHPVERVWRAITDPAEVRQWFEPIQLDLREGGAWDMGATEGGWAGQITAFEPMRRLRMDHAPGAPPVDPGAYLQYELEPVTGGTRLIFTHHLPGVAGGLARPGDGVAGGWHEIFDRLTEWLDGKPIAAGLPMTDMAHTLEAWAAMKVRSGEFDAEAARRHVMDLRREEAAGALNRQVPRTGRGGCGRSGRRRSGAVHQPPDAGIRAHLSAPDRTGLARPHRAEGTGPLVHPHHPVGLQGRRRIPLPRRRLHGPDHHHRGAALHPLRRQFFAGPGVGVVLPGTN